jgi:hypothetical protein
VTPTGVTSTPGYVTRLPHPIVLRDLDTKTSYWAHVTPEAVVPTGKGAKILVSAHQRVDEDDGEALLEVAGANVPGLAWEGSVWMAGAEIVPRDLLRHSLITPRLVAPHPNAGTGDEITPQQAVALLMQGELSRLRRFAEEHDSALYLHEAHESPDWTWRFAAALRARVVTGGLAPLLGMPAEAPDVESRTAATIAAACALIEDRRVDDALPLLDDEIQRDAAGAVDHAWLLVQRARARADIGDFAGAQDDALGAQGVRLGASKDATAGAIAASAAILVFSTAAFTEKDVRSMITTADTAANWWRRQTIASGLWVVAEDAFAAWTDTSPTVYADGDRGHNKLAAAALMAGHAGDHAAWRAVSAVAASSDLLQLHRDADPEAVAAAVTNLRRTDTPSRRHAAQRGTLAGEEPVFWWISAMAPSRFHLARTGLSGSRARSTALFRPTEQRAAYETRGAATAASVERQQRDSNRRFRRDDGPIRSVL